MSDLFICIICLICLSDYLSDLFYLLFISETSDTVLVFVSLCEFHFHTVEDDIALLRVLMRNKPGSVKLRMIMSVPSA